MNKTKLILIVEDNKSLRLLMSHYLSKTFQIVTKINGLDAMRWLNEGRMPDLILLDLEMPKMSGIDFLNGLRLSGIHGEVPIIIISSNQPNIIANYEQLDVFGYFRKPFDPRKLQKKIENLFEYNKYQIID